MMRVQKDYDKVLQYFLLEQGPNPLIINRTEKLMHVQGYEDSPN